MDKDYLVLKRASASRPSGEWSDDHFDVLADGVVVGRIMKAQPRRSGHHGCGPSYATKIVSRRTATSRRRDGGVRQELAAGVNERSSAAGLRHLAGSQIVRFLLSRGTSLLVYLIKPLVENPAARPLQPFAKAGRILTDRARINFRFIKFNRVANQPGFDALRLRLDVKLNSEQVRPFPECLGRAMTRECKILASRR